MDANIVANLEAILEQKKSYVSNHNVFKKIRTLADLRVFMEWHIFAVWDFMSLVKRLQIEFSCVTLPWIPTKTPGASRLINDIVLAEESDEAFRSGYSSHFDLYLEAMKEVGASTEKIIEFVNLVGSNTSYQHALEQVKVPKPVRDFVTSTLECSIQGQTIEVLGSFLNGREDSIPKMFQSLIESWGINESSAPIFIYYLKRHIELDGDKHGPAAERLSNEYISGDLKKRQKYLESSIAAVNQRISLWDALSDKLTIMTAESEEQPAHA